jgi:hypothetical protein
LAKFNIQKHLLTLHLGLRGVNTELLDTFPTQNLVDKSDSDVCVTYRFILSNDNLEKEFNEAVPKICSLLDVEKKSFEKVKETQDAFELPVFYTSLNMHWSDQATLDFESLTSLLSPVGIRMSLKVSISN